MQRDGWWWTAPHLTNKWIKRQMFKDMLTARLRKLHLAPAGPEALPESRVEKLS
jgi:hypothetical protein